MSTTSLEKKLIKEKLASLIVAVAIRTWPQQWPAFRIFLESLFQTSSHLAPIEVALLIIKTFAEDLFIYNTRHIDESRYQELRTAMIAEAPAFLRLVSEYMRKLVSFLSSSPTDFVDRQLQQTIFIEAINVWTAYVEWSPFQ